MNTYTPDRWVVLEFTNSSLETSVQKIFAGWYGGFYGGDSWKLNSGNVSCHKNNNWYEFLGYSGSVYTCHVNGYGMNHYMQDILTGWLRKAEASGDTNITIISLDNIITL